MTTTLGDLEQPDARPRARRSPRSTRSVAVSIPRISIGTPHTLRRVGSNAAPSSLHSRRSRSSRAPSPIPSKASSSPTPSSNRSGSRCTSRWSPKTRVDDVAPLDEHDPLGTPRAPRAPGRRSRRCGRAGTGRRGATSLAPWPRSARVVGVHERERRRRDRLGHAQRRAEALRERRLAGTHLAGQHDQVAAGEHSPAIAAAIAWVSASEVARSSSIVTTRHGGVDVTSVTARHATSDAAHDLVADRAEPIGPVLGPNGLATVGPVLAPDQHHPSPIPTASSPQSTISWSMVTTPTIGRRRPPISTSPPVVEQAPGHPVGVSDRHGRHRGVPLEDVPQAVGDPAARRAPASRTTPAPRATSPDATRRTGRRRRRRARSRRSRCRRERTNAERRDGPVPRPSWRRARADTVAATYQRVDESSSKRASWSSVNGSSGSSASARCVKTPTRRSAGAWASTAATMAAAPSTATPTRCMPVSILRCTGTPVTPRPRAAEASASTNAARVHRGHQPEADDVVGGLDRLLAEDQDRCVDAGDAQLRRPPPRERRTVPRAPPSSAARATSTAPWP